MRINEGELGTGHVRVGAPGGPVSVDGFRTAADHVVALAAAVPSGQWDAPALGEWSVRSLVGHIGRALTTVVDYLARPAIEQTVPSTAEYYLLAAELVDSDAVRRRGEQAGAELGEYPAATLAQMRDRALHALAYTDDRLVTTAVGGMLLSHYLPTRTFELAVHGLDLARATGQPESVPVEPLREVVALATELAVRRGHGETVLLALTGRGIMPSDLSVV
ncbi:maleylpyruvate isomerase family mycothiol-dependent enzyme (plasmid) [Rhodococcus rhodochrous]|uniref:maleylpyruvate isomerase family mycothiol-dependent enzyme n=1 Tax=Rhodococcus rhodochrous TaxID=1829 RepID=UPI00132F3F81|nr:maleylpyruvate isomerase N-terminal domain-containing protein [Rhodococcus rhodochrous]QHG85438.1 maleylpyruvate isomerase family mycothiol-dependent enzyme [Rhodococcus rhodochrous]